MTKYIDIIDYKTLYKVKKTHPKAYKIKKCYMGWMVFENSNEFDSYMIDERKSKNMYVNSKI